MKLLLYFLKAGIIGFLPLLGMLFLPLAKDNIVLAGTGPNGSLSIISAPSVVKPSESFAVVAQLCNTTGSTRLVEVEATADRDGSATPSNSSYSLAAGECRNINFTITAPSPTANTCPTGSNNFGFYLDSLGGFGSDTRFVQLYSQVGLTVTNNSPDAINVEITGTNFGGSTGHTFSVGPNGQANGPNDLWTVNCNTTANVVITISVTRQSDGAPMGSFTSAPTRVQNGCHFQVRMDYDGPAATPIPPTLTPTPIPPTATPVPPRIDSAFLTCSNASNPPILDASWVGNNLNNCNVYIVAGTQTYQLSTACNGSWTKDTLPGGPPVNFGGTYQLNASDGVNNRQSTVTCPPAPTITPTPTPIPNCPVASACCQAPLTRCTSNAGCTASGYNWCWNSPNGYCINNNYNPASNSCPVPTPTPTPGAISVFGNPVCVGTNSQINWSWSGGRVYKKLTLFNDTLGASQDFTPSSDQTTFTSSGLPYNNRFRLQVTDAAGRSGTSVPPEVSKTCAGPTPTPTPPGGTPPPGTPTPTPTPGVTCTGTGESCFDTRIGYSSGCQPTTTSKNLWCQAQLGPVYACQYCQPPPPPRACSRPLPPNDAPTVTLRPDGHTLEITYRYATGSGEESGSLLLPSFLANLFKKANAQAGAPDIRANIFRSTTRGFVPGGELRQVQVGNAGFSFLRYNSSSAQTYYYQVVAKNQTGTSPSNTFGVVVPAEYESRCRNSFLSGPHITGASPGVRSFDSFKFTLYYQVADNTGWGCGYNQCSPGVTPQYLRISGSSTGLSALIPWKSSADGNYCDQRRFWWPWSCTLSKYYTTYEIGLPRGTWDTFRVVGDQGQACSSVSSFGEANFSGGTFEGQASQPAGHRILGSASSTNDGTPYVSLGWEQEQNYGHLDEVYESQTRWSGTSLSTIRSFDGGWVFTVLDDLSNLESGTYYYGAQLDLYGIVGACDTRYVKTDQASFTWAASPQISGNVYIDTNGNGAKDTGEQPYQGATINFSGASSGTATTNASGNYTFVATTGDYTVRLNDISGYAPSTTNPVNNVTLPPNKIVNFGIQPLYSIAGTVFIDDDQNKVKEGGEKGYAESSTVTFTNTLTGQKTQAVTNNGDYTSSVTLSAGTYTVAYTTLPSGYAMTYPLNGPPPSILVTVGTSCVNGIPPNTTTCSSGNASNVNFGIAISNPWIQGKGADMRVDSGFTNLLPPNFYTILQGDFATPGVAFTGDTNADFGKGQASINQFNWLVGGSATTKHPEVFSPKTPGVMRTSYNYGLATIKQTGASTIDMSTTCTLTNCTLPANLTEGVYLALSTVDLNAYTFPAGKNFVFLINGNLNINGDIKVPIGSTATFIVSGSIIVSSSVGVTPASSTITNIEGFFSGDNSFIIKTATSGNKCNADGSPIDKRLNIAGSVVANAKLTGGRFDNRRDLCNQNGTYPTVYITERVDMLLNAPSFIKHPNFVWQEVAP